MNWKESLQPYLDKHRVVGSGSSNDLLDAIQVEIIEKLIDEIPDRIVLGKGIDATTGVAWQTSNLKQQLRREWL